MNPLNKSGLFLIAITALHVAGHTNEAVAADRLALTKSCEIAVARSALPKRLREGASVYALVGQQYEKVIEGDGNFTCIVMRNHPNSVIPQCMDKHGVETVLPVLIDRGEMLVAGQDLETIQTVVSQGYDSGKYQTTSRPGVNYMMSDYNYIFTSASGDIRKVPPHVMFYAPDTSNEDIGGSFLDLTANSGTPFVVQQDSQGYMITYTEHEADADEVAMSCAGQLGERPPAFNPLAASGS